MKNRPLCFHQLLTRLLTGSSRLSWKWRRTLFVLLSLKKNKYSIFLLLLSFDKIKREESCVSQRISPSQLVASFQYFPHFSFIFIYFFVIFFRKRKWRYYDIRFSFFSFILFLLWKGYWGATEDEEDELLYIFFPFFIGDKSIVPKRPICHCYWVVIYSPLSPSPHCVYRRAFCSPSVVVIDELPTRSRTRHLFLKGKNARN